MFSCLNLRIPLCSTEESFARFMAMIERIAEFRVGLDFSVSVLVLGERILMKHYYILFLRLFLFSSHNLFFNNAVFCIHGNNFFAHFFYSCFFFCPS